MKKYPFKFLDSYSREDADIFFGREKETEALYDALNARTETDPARIARMREERQGTNAREGGRARARIKGR